MTTRAHLAALLAIGLILAPAVRAAGTCSLSVGWEPYGAYIYVDDRGAVTGADIELVKTLAEDIGCTVSLMPLPWARHLLELEAGRVDVATSVRRSPEREAYGWFSDAYRHNEMALYVRRGEVDRYRLDTLDAIPRIGFTLGIVDGYYYGPRFAELMAQPAFARQVEIALDYQTNIRKLVYGRIDGLLADDVGVLVHEARALGLYERLEVYPLRLDGDTFHLMFSKKSVPASVVAAINASLERMKGDGRLQRLFDRYLK